MISKPDLKKKNCEGLELCYYHIITRVGCLRALVPKFSEEGDLAD